MSFREEPASLGTRRLAHGLSTVVSCWTSSQQRFLSVKANAFEHLTERALSNFFQFCKKLFWMCVRVQGQKVLLGYPADTRSCLPLASLARGSSPSLPRAAGMPHSPSPSTACGAAGCTQQWASEVSTAPAPGRTELFLWDGHIAFVRHICYKYFLPVHSLPFHLLNYVFLSSFKVW